MVRDAEAHADEDSKKREAVDTRNQAESMVYQVEKALKENGDKIDADKKAKVESAIEDLKNALKGDDIDAIKAKQEALTNEMNAIAEQMYASQQQGPAAGADYASNASDANSSSSNSKNDEKVVDADFEMKD